MFELGLRSEILCVIGVIFRFCLWIDRGEMVDWDGIGGNGLLYFCWLFVNECGLVSDDCDICVKDELVKEKFKWFFLWF